jgi:uncharacterized protein (UPF0332 family)
MTNFAWNQFLEVAKDVHIAVQENVTINLRAAKIRTAVSRAYYAAFHQGFYFASGRATKVDRSQHAWTIKFFLHQCQILGTFNPAQKQKSYEIGQMLFTLYDLRIWADYRDQPFIDDLYQVEMAIILSDEACKLIGELEQEIPRRK